MSFKRWLFLASILFAAGLAWGLTFSGGTTGPLDANVSALKQLADFLSTLARPSVAAIIFLKNVLAVLAGFVLSPFFCLVPVAVLVLNGGLIGLVAVPVVQQKSLGFLLAGILPHGIFEIPALIIGEAASLSFGTAVILSLFNEEKRKLLRPNLKQNLKYLAVAVILLFPAALMETYVTPLLVR